MAETENRTGGKFVSMDISEAQAKLDRLERQEWWRWSAALIIMLVLTLGLMALSLLDSRPGHLDQLGTRTAIRGLLGLVILFDLFAIRQQQIMTRMRRELASQLGVISALETLKLVLPKTPEAENERRQWQRSNCNQRLTVVATSEEKTSHLYGRVRDICEHGIGAIVPGDLKPQGSVVLRFSLDDVRSMELHAIVRHRSGFRYGFEFVNLKAEDYQAIERFRMGDAGLVVPISGETSQEKE